ncbi:MAG: hypothetical protein OEM81_08440 [Acidimicrobiia bacterium]|nr:hypothetical protein [Acidimicrobiia bacterium]MDH3397841.1 hypothetical protein [Acidimicrobiia bacterium]MDH5615620.1 hypothetical protein [Acidimicrobiia bacterium]
MSYFVIRTAETWTWSGILLGFLLLTVLAGIGAAVYFVTRDR